MSVPRGVLIRYDTVSGDGEHQDADELVVTLEDDTIDVRLKDDDDTIVMLNLPEVEEALRTLKRWERDS